jgi:hypothetical protein
MGCCNKEMDETPISDLRYWAGTALVAGSHVGLLAVLAAASPVIPQCKRVLPFFYRYTRDTLEGILNNERIVRGSNLGRDACELEDLGAR